MVNLIQKYNIRWLLGFFLALGAIFYSHGNVLLLGFIVVLVLVFAENYLSCNQLDGWKNPVKQWLVSNYTKQNNKRGSYI